MVRIRQIKVPIDIDEEKLIDYTSKKVGIKSSEIKKISIVKKSLDARKKPNLYFIYEVDIEIDNEEKLISKHNPDIFTVPLEIYNFNISGQEEIKERPVIIGSGPAGLFCAYLLAEHGYKPLIIERGEKIEDRINTVEKFWNTGILQENSNVQFGEGGAGTFSDGKLNTLIKDKFYRGKKAFEIFVENGAPKEIMYLNKPHIGTDNLRNVVKNIREKIIKMGGEFRYNTTMTNININNSKIESIEINNKEKIDCNILVLAIGHSARDTFDMLYSKKISMNSKPFAVGIRIEHPQEMINISQYGTNDEKLPPADYKLTYTTKEKRGVYSFCMCPGGYVVNASSEQNKLAINGMSNYRRNSKNANSAIIVTVNSKDYGEDVFSGVRFQQKLEELAYLEGQGKIPTQLYKDYLSNNKSTTLENIDVITKGEISLANLNNIFPTYINAAIKEAMPYFGTKIKGFDREDAILLGVESRTSSPIRIDRDENFESNIKGIYPCGEGAGYAGGITSSAIDGIKIAEAIAKKYKPN